jgi:hydroxymethylbilane synthase
MRPLVYATRRSALALAQCRAFIATLQAACPGLAVTELQVVTTGDRVTDRPLAEIGGKGLFVKEIEEALLDRRADLAVHSVKDVPAVLPAGLTLACVPPREDARDALVAPAHLTLDALPRGARVGTSSLRRKVALEARRPDLVVAPLRGNVDTRLRKVDAGEYDGIVLARAGLVRLGLAERVTEVLEVDVSLPAVGQGALGIECREDDAEVRELLARVHDAGAAACVAAERGVLAALGADCRTPLAAHALRRGDAMHLRAWLARADGGAPSRGEALVGWPSGEEQAREIGEAVGAEMGRSSPLAPVRP